MNNGDSINCCAQANCLKPGGGKRLNLFFQVVKFLIDYEYLKPYASELIFKNDFTELRRVSMESGIYQNYLNELQRSKELPF